MRNTSHDADDTDHKQITSLQAEINEIKLEIQHYETRIRQLQELISEFSSDPVNNQLAIDHDVSVTDTAQGDINAGSGV